MIRFVDQLLYEMTITTLKKIFISNQFFNVDVEDWRLNLIKIVVLNQNYNWRWFKDLEKMKTKKTRDVCNNDEINPIEMTMKIILKLSLLIFMWFELWRRNKNIRWKQTCIITKSFLIMKASTANILIND